MTDKDLEGASMPSGIEVDEAAAYFGVIESSDMVHILMAMELSEAFEQFFSILSDIVLLPGDFDFEAASERYHLYVSLACPWAHRTLIIRLLKGLSEHVGVSIVHPLMKENGWELTNDYPSTTGDPILGKSAIYEIYLKANPFVTSRASVPVCLLYTSDAADE